MSALKTTIVSFFLFLAGLFGHETNIGADPRVLQESQGGTGTSTYQLGDIIYASGTNQLGRLPIGSSGQVLEVTGGIPAWATDDTGGGGGSGSIYSGMNWAYIRGGIRNNTSTDQVLIGATATSTLANLEIQGNTTASGSLRGDNFVMTSNTLSSIQSGLIVSGSSTFASSLNISGNLNASSTAFFVYVSSTALNSGYVSSTMVTTSQFYAQGLGDCDNATGSKVLWDTTTGRFSCGSDQNTGTGGGFGEAWTVTSSLAIAPTSTIYGTIVANSSTFKNSLHITGQFNVSGTSMFGSSLLPALNDTIDIGQYSRAVNEIFVSSSIFLGGAGEQVQWNGGSFNAEGTVEFNVIRSANGLSFSTANGGSPTDPSTGGISYTIGNATDSGDAGNFTVTGGSATDGLASNIVYTPGLSASGRSGDFIVYDPDGSTENLRIYSNSIIASSGTLRIHGLSTFLGGVSTTAINAQYVSSTQVTTTNFFGARLYDCDDATNSKLLWDASTGRFSCGSDQNSGGGSSAGVSFDYFPLFLTPSTTIGLAIATSTANQGGLFAVNTSGNISTSGTLEVFGRSRFAGVVNASSTLLVSSSLTVGQGPGYNLGQVHVSSGNIFASGTLDVQGNVYASGSIYATQLSVFQNGIGTGPAGSILTNDGILQLTNSTLNQLDLGSHQFISSGRFNFILDSNNDGSNPLTDKSIFFSSNITDQFNNSGERRLMTVLYPGIILMSNGGADFGGMTNGLHSTTTVSSSLFAFNVNSSTFAAGRFRIEANGDLSSSGTTSTFYGAVSTTRAFLTGLPAAPAGINPVCVDANGATFVGSAGVCPVSALSSKRNLEPISYGLEELRRVDFFDFLMDDGRIHSGPVADYLEEHMPNLVIKKDGKVVGYDYVSMIGVLGQSVKDLDDEVQELKKMNGVKRDNRELYAILGIGSILILISLRRKYGHGRTH